MIKAAIFDMDGVIIDSEPIQMLAINKVLAQWSIQLSDKDFIPMIGRRLSDDYNYLKERFGIPVDFPEFWKMKNATYQNLIKESIEEMPGLSRLITELKQAGIKRAVASGSIRADIDIVLNGLGLQSEFDVITAGNEVKHGKPHPEIYLLTSSRLEVNPEDCVALEDTYYGLCSAKSAGMKCIAVPHKYTAQQDFSRADLTTDSLNNISLSVIQQLNHSSKD